MSVSGGAPMTWTWWTLPRTWNSGGRGSPPGRSAPAAAGMSPTAIRTASAMAVTRAARMSPLPPAPRTVHSGREGSSICFRPGDTHRVALVPVPVIVQKYGGTSVADPDRIRAVAEHIARTHRQDNQVIVVVSAMGKTTDDLVRLAHDVAQDPHGREMDMLLTAGERISMALLCMAIMDHGVHAVSFTGSQAGIVTDTAHGKAKILEIKGDRIRETLANGSVAVVAGFQGISTARDITTLGRGGSDTTAVALAATLGAEVCEIYTDMSGVFTADPRVVPEARKLARVSYNEMLEMAATGGRVLALRSVEFARNYGVPVH